MQRRIKTHIEALVTGQAALSMWVSLGDIESLANDYLPTSYMPKNGKT